jgi:2-polyprenyl-3-methyl-5-hydroxy-6-metoxy-1,4-benzoquinol methylase
VSNYAVCPDALIQRRGSKWCFSNPKTRTHVILSQEAVGALARVTDAEPQTQWLSVLSDCQGFDATEEFFGENGLHTDHSGIRQKPASAVSGPDLFALLRKRWLVVEEGSERYEQYFGRLKSILDRDHLGTFHERVGQYMTIKKRLKAERWRWWHDQKFTPDGLAVNPGPYKYMQQSFIDNYFVGKDLSGQKILDFACGNGFYSAKLAALDAQVTGLDLSSELIEIARRNHGDKINFVCPASIEEELQWLDKQSDQFDALFMQDILLLLLNPEDGKKSEGVSKMLTLFYKILKGGGCIYMMEPNPSFWLAGRYGDTSKPYAIVTEYREQCFNVMPNLTTVVQAMAEAGFGLTEYLHPTFSQNSEEAALAHSFADRFPIWDFMRFTPIKK